MEFKESAIYQLPNGRELVARVSNNRAAFFNLSASHAGHYELNDEGRLLLERNVTAWGVEDLVDTGRTAAPDLVATMLADTSRETDETYEQNLNV